jgi:hypothetical protein
MTIIAAKRIRGERPSKEERQRALSDAIKLPSAPPRPIVAPVTVVAIPVDRPAMRRSRAKYAD